MVNSSKSMEQIGNMLSKAHEKGFQVSINMSNLNNSIDIPAKLVFTHSERFDVEQLTKDALAIAGFDEKRLLYTVPEKYGISVYMLL